MWIASDASLPNAPFIGSDSITDDASGEAFVGVEEVSDADISRARRAPSFLSVVRLCLLLGVTLYGFGGTDAVLDGGVPTDFTSLAEEKRFFFGELTISGCPPFFFPLARMLRFLVADPLIFDIVR